MENVTVQRIRIDSFHAARVQLQRLAVAEKAIGDVQRNVGSWMLDEARRMLGDVLKQVEDFGSACRITATQYEARMEAEIQTAVNEGVTGKGLNNFKQYGSNIRTALLTECPILEEDMEKGVWTYPTESSIRKWNKDFSDWCKAVAAAEARAEAEAAGLVAPIKGNDEKGAPATQEAPVSADTTTDPLGGFQPDVRSEIEAMLDALRECAAKPGGQRAVKDKVQKLMAKEIPGLQKFLARAADAAEQDASSKAA